MVNTEAWAPCTLSPPALNGSWLRSFCLLSLDLCDPLRSETLAELSEFAPGFHLLKGTGFSLSILVSPAPAAVASAEWCAIHVCRTIESLGLWGFWHILRKKKMLHVEKKIWGGIKTKVQREPLLKTVRYIASTLQSRAERGRQGQGGAGRGRVGQGGAVLAHLWIPRAQHHGGQRDA